MAGQSFVYSAQIPAGVAVCHSGNKSFHEPEIPASVPGKDPSVIGDIDIYCANGIIQEFPDDDLLAVRVDFPRVPKILVFRAPWNVNAVMVIEAELPSSKLIFTT